jgi:hypothetical protein
VNKSTAREVATIKTFAASKAADQRTYAARTLAVLLRACKRSDKPVLEGLIDSCGLRGLLRQENGAWVAVDV